MMSRSEKSLQLEKEIKTEEVKEKNHHILKTFLKIIFFILLTFTLILLYMHFIGTKGLLVREYKVESSRLPESFHGFKVVHFSDLHYLTTIKEKEVKKLVDKINELRPDVIVFTGDLISQDKIVPKDKLNFLINELNRLEATTGKYTVKGNHDYAHNYYEKVFNETDFKQLNNSYELIYYKGNVPILITGTNSCLQRDCDIGSSFNYNETDNIYTISLFHEPDIIDSMINTYPIDLALAGHSHNGQIRIPFLGALVKANYGKKYPNESYQLNHTQLFVSGGLGTSKCELRWFNHPSINLYRLTKEGAVK